MSSHSPQDPSTNTGIAVAIAEMRVELRGAVQDIRENRDEMRTANARLEADSRARTARLEAKLEGEVKALRGDLAPLKEAAQQRRGVNLFSKAGALWVGALAGVASIIGLLIAILTQGPA